MVALILSCDITRMREKPLPGSIIVKHSFHHHTIIESIMANMPRLSGWDIFIIITSSDKHQLQDSLQT